MSGSALTYLEPKLCELLAEAYEGELDDSNNYSGKGELKMLDGSSYDGQFLDGLMHGQGTYNWPNGVSYTGEFFQGTISGSGKYTWPDGSTYTGHLKSGKRHGEGVFMCSAGQIYDGEWQDGYRHGKGVASYYEGKSTTVYTGEWYKDLRQGYGTMRYASGNQYEGYWYAGKKCGKGVMVWGADQSTYVGTWEEDLPNGSGEILWSNLKISKLVTKQMSSVYRGTMKNGEKSGDGSFIYADGSQYSGQWDKDVKHGDGVVIHGNGRMEATQFKEGRMMNESKIPTPQKTKTSPNKHSSPSTGGQVSASGSKDLKLIITDLIQALPRVDASSTEDRKTLPPVYVDAASLSGLEHDLERIMLRYQAILRKVYHSLTSSSKLDTRKDSLDTLVRNSEPALSAIDKAITDSVVKHQTYLCLSLNRFKAYAREVGITGAQYTSKDLSTTYQQMISGRFQAAEAAYLKQHGKGDDSVIVPTLHTVVGSNIGPTSVSEKGKDFEVPLSELDFVNLLVRASVESTVRSGIVEASSVSSKAEVEAVRAPMSLQEVLRLALDSVQRHWEAKHEVAPAQVALVSPMTQNCLRKEKKAFFKGLWEKLSVGKDTVAMGKVMQFLEGLQKTGAVDAGVGLLDVMDIARGIVRPKAAPESVDPSRPPTAAADSPTGEAAEGDEGAAAPEGGQAPAEGEAEAAPEGEEAAEEKKEEAPVASLPPMPPMDAMTSLSVLSKQVDYEDFLELLCTVVMSDSWIYEDPAIKIKAEEEAAAAAAAAAAGEGENGEGTEENAPPPADADVPVEEAKESAADAPTEKVTPPKELPELLVERLVTFSSCFDLTIL